jgi:hypothetical protein
LLICVDAVRKIAALFLLGTLIPMPQAVCQKTTLSVPALRQELKNSLANPSIDDYYKEIFRKGKLVKADDDAMLSIVERLFTDDTENDFFYFMVFTKSMNGSDGFYGEAVGFNALKFVTERTHQFAEYFNVVPELTDKDMNEWASNVYGEISISRENEEAEAVKELKVRLLKKEFERKEHKAVIESFIAKLESRLH